LSGFWQSAACSADGAKLVLANSDSGGIWVNQSTPSLPLKLRHSGDHLKAAWTLPSMNFRLLESSGLVGSNWTEVTNIRTLNFTNLEHEVDLVSSNNCRFYRLIAP
jgi:hypothetical protein